MKFVGLVIFFFVDFDAVFLSGAEYRSLSPSCKNVTVQSDMLYFQHLIAQSCNFSKVTTRKNLDISKPLVSGRKKHDLFRSLADTLYLSNNRVARYIIYILLSC